MGVIDTHCHLTFPDFEGRLDRVLADASAAGVSGAITISTTTENCLEGLAVARAHANVWCTSGVHPLYADDGPHVWENLRTVAEDVRCVAWGELGLDNHYPEPAKERQHEVLVEQLRFIRACREGRLYPRPGEREIKPIDKPIVLHCREAFDDLIPILRSSGLDCTRMVFHCFTAGPEEMRKILDLGSMVSFTGVVTYKNAGPTREAAKLVPADRFMVETDAPYLSPEPVRMKRPCEPAMVRHTAEALAVLRGVSFAQLHEQINENTARFFGIPAR